MTDVPEKQSNPSKIWLIAAAVAAVAFVVCLACGIFAYQKWFKADAEDVAATYLAAVKDKDAAEMREHTCASKRDEIDEQDMKDDEDRLLDWKILSTKEHDSSANVTAEITATDNGKTRTSNVTITLVKEDGDWKVCTFRAS
ncbi:Rv0361 family membrane protein [Catelliglobosispora koreensis]|uniref:Rv0361 family membrane protein n=1 Tax=Catelliglobosispora koreensis TaxID=129052 RepID=UPI00036B031A|nr:DUF4878 domain-containing protein [Catelliglobosispora koreensis]